MTAPIDPRYRRIYRARTDPNGTRWAYSRGVPDIQIGAGTVVPPAGAKVDVISRLRGKGFYVPPSSGRDGVVYSSANALLFPTASWSTLGGPLPGVALTRFPASGEGDYTVPASAANSVPTTIDGVATGSPGTGTAIENMEFFGVVRLNSLANVWFKNCIFHGTVTPRVSTGCIEAANLNMRGAVIQDAWLDVRNNNTFHTGIRGSFYTLKRAEVSGGADGISFNTSGGNVTLLGNWIHNGAYDEWAAGDTNFPSQGSNYLHCDGVQGGQGKNYYARGNYIGGHRLGAYAHHAGFRTQILAGDDFYNSAVLMAQAPAQADGVQYLMTNVLFEQNVFEGGTATINVATSNGYDLSGVTFKDNVFPFAFFGGGQWYILRPVGCNAVFTNNRHTNGALVPIVTG